jgi:type I restriction enzyme, S subunit
MAKVSGEYLPLSVLGEFPSDWSESTLEEVCHQVTDGTHDSPKPVDEGGYPLVTGKAIKDRRVDFSVTYNISDAEHQKVIERSKPERDDILFANIGNSIGDLVRVQTDRPFSIKNVALFKPNPSKVSARYLEYFLLSEQVQGFIKGSTRGSAQPFIGLGSLRGFPVPLPPMNEQLSIGALLGALDDRITLLRETNTTLETIAQALFKSWFVDFDPVRAKAEGRQPDGMDAATAALFPDSFEESELGLVPKGWRVFRVEDLMELAYGKALKSTDRVDGQVPVYGSGGITGYHDQSLLEGPGIIVGRKGTVGSLYWEDCPFFPIDTVFYVKAKKPLTYCYYLLRTLGLEGMNTDGAVPGLNRGNAYRLRAVVPPEAVLEGFDGVASRLRGRIFANAQQAQTLTQLRDILLPPLISGQLRLPEAQAMLNDRDIAQ